MGERILVLGGTRSGKSAAAEALVTGTAQVAYLATGQPSDDEMTARIAAHRARRPAHWATVETPDLVAGLDRSPAGAAVLVDSLGGWVSAALDADAALDRLKAFWDAAAARPGGPVVVVAELVGEGLVPPDPLTRRWVDMLGDAAQLLAADADRVLQVVAGRATPLPARTPPADRATGGPATGLRAHGDTMVPPGALDLAVNVWGDGPPEHIRMPITASLDGLAGYPADGDARTAVALRHGRDPAEVCVTAGAAEAFWLLAATLEARRPVIVHPQFTEPEAALRAAGLPVAHCYRRPGDGWALDPTAVPDDADLVVVGNPNNPTGTLDAPEVVAAVCRPGRTTVVDEAFMDFVEDPAASLAARSDLPGLVVVRSVTKLWGLAGLRAGYLLAPPVLVDRLRCRRQPWAVSTPALAAVAACAADEQHRLEVARRVTRERERLAAALAARTDVEVWRGAANFLLLRVPDGPRVHAGLLERGIAVRPSTFPGLDASHLRVSVRDAPSSERLAGALTAILTA
ncbi:MAG: Rv2231c family pyridoxal phosphate-dependent protein CobC [Egibacteraceae bacterium]